jgi:hypothetical protein
MIHSSFTPPATEQAGLSVTSKICILEMVGWNPRLDASYVVWGSEWFSPLTSGKFRHSASINPRPLPCKYFRFIIINVNYSSQMYAALWTVPEQSRKDILANPSFLKKLVKYGNLLLGNYAPEHYATQFMIAWSSSTSENWLVWLWYSVSLANSVL